MGLKQDIVIKSEYTNNANSKPGGGSRGASPGQYVMRYMAREDATEVLTPVKIESQQQLVVSDVLSSDDYDSAAFTRYMARSDATERLKSRQDELLNDDPDAYGSPLVLKHRFRSMDKQSGRAFGSKGLSLSQDELVESSDTIQDAFNNGHSVQKIILSFTEDYLRETGVIDKKFKHKGRGSYMGNVDQLKLRTAISSGMDHMLRAGQFEAPEWVGTVQLDTSHVHAHIAAVDTEFSEFRMHNDGADRGKINEREKRMFRKGVHFSLEDMADLKSFHKQASLERQNVRTFVKDYAYATLYDNTSIQLLMASLPKDRSAWRYGTNRESMQHSNDLATNIVEGVFEREPVESGYNAAMSAVYDYADESARKNKLSDDERDTLVVNGRSHIVERSVNGLYSVLKTLDDNQLQTRTPMTDIQSSSDAALTKALKQGNDDSSEFDPVAFTLRVRGYNKREASHQSDARMYYDLAKEYDVAEEAGYVDDTAHVMRLFYEEEQRYHMGLTDKYRTFLSFRHPNDRQNVDRLIPEYEALVSRYNDIQSDESEAGVTDYESRDRYMKDVQDYTMQCFDMGLATLKEWDAVVDYDRDSNDVNPRFVLPIQPKVRQNNLTPSHFDSVKALDVHHLGLDYYNHPDARIDAINVANFANAWQSRLDKAAGAQVYAESTGQSLGALDRALDDINDMEFVVVKAQNEGLIQTVSIDDLISTEERQLYTTSVDKSFDVSSELRTTLETFDVGDFESDSITQREIEAEMEAEAERDAQVLE